MAQRALLARFDRLRSNELVDATTTRARRRTLLVSKLVADYDHLFRATGRARITTRARITRHFSKLCSEGLWYG